MIDLDFERLLESWQTRNPTRPCEAAEEQSMELNDAVQQAPPVETRIPTVGRIVLFKVPARGGSWMQNIFDNGVQEGDLLPAVIVRTWGSTPDAAVNLRVFCDSVHDAWITSVVRGDTPYSWQWPARS